MPTATAVGCTGDLVCRGRIESQRQLAENVWLLSLDVLDVPSGIVGTISTKSSLGSTENPNFKKWADFSCVHVEMG